MYILSNVCYDNIQKKRYREWEVQYSSYIVKLNVQHLVVVVLQIQSQYTPSNMLNNIPDAVLKSSLSLWFKEFVSHLIWVKTHLSTRSHVSTRPHIISRPHVTTLSPHSRGWMLKASRTAALKRISAEIKSPTNVPSSTNPMKYKVEVVQGHHRKAKKQNHNN